MKSHSSIAVAVITLTAGSLLAACAGGTKTGDGTYDDGLGGSGAGTTTNQACIPNQQLACACPGGTSGVQVCLADGSGLGACDCGGGQGGSPPLVGCGDGVCGLDEDCHSCMSDCGICEPCLTAPACDNAAIPNPSLPHRTDLDVPAMQLVPPAAIAARLTQKVLEAGAGMRLVAAALDDDAREGEHPVVATLRNVFASHPTAAASVRRQLERAGMDSPASYRDLHMDSYAPPTPSVLDVAPPGGTEACGAPLLRLTVSQITVHEEDDDFANDIVYCTIRAEAQTGTEIRITPETPNLDQGDSFQFALESGVFWGQQGPTTPGGNLQITYDCVEADTSDGYQNLINDIGNAASTIGDVWTGSYGWVFTAVGAVAPIVSDALALDGDDHLFNAQQIVPLSMQLELTNGAYWTVRRAGTHILSDWDWELFIKAWGCAEYGQL